MLVVMMLSNVRKEVFMYRCHAFASNANRQQKYNSRSASAMRLQHTTTTNNNNYSWVIRGGGSQVFSLETNAAKAATRLSSTASPLRESSSVGKQDEFEKRATESLSIASGGTTPTSIKSFGGLTYRDSLSPKSSSLFRVVFVLGGPGKTSAKMVTVAQK